LRAEDWNYQDIVKGRVLKNTKNYQKCGFDDTQFYVDKDIFQDNGSRCPYNGFEYKSKPVS